MVKTVEEFKRNLEYAGNDPVVGFRYWETRELDIAEIAKLIRNNIKELIHRHKIPKVKYSVKIRRHAGGQSINITGFGVPEVFAKVTRARLEDLLDSYNYDGSHSQSDYYCRRFHQWIEIRMIPT